MGWIVSAVSNAPMIVRPKKIIAAGHHECAWKGAHANAVTAIMSLLSVDTGPLAPQRRRKEVSVAEEIFLPAKFWFLSIDKVAIEHTQFLTMRPSRLCS